MGVDATPRLQRPLLASQAAVPMRDGLAPWARRAERRLEAGGWANSTIVGQRICLHCPIFEDPKPLESQGLP